MRNKKTIFATKAGLSKTVTNRVIYFQKCIPLLKGMNAEKHPNGKLDLF